MNLFELFVKIGAKDEASGTISKITSGLGKGLKTAAKVGTAAVATVTAAATAMTTTFIKGTSEVAQYGDNIDKMSQKMGLSAKAYQEWDFIMQHSGTSMEALKAGMKTLANAVDSGNDAFERLGISQAEVASMNQEELFAKTIEQLQKVENETERTYLAGQLLGRGATELGALLNTSAEDTEAMRQQVHELGGVMSNEAVKAAAAYQDSLQNMQTAFSGIQRGMLSEFLPSMVTVMDGLALIFSGNDSGIAKITEGVNQFADKLMEAVPKIFELGEGILSSLATAILDNLPTLTSTATSVIINLVGGIVSALPVLAESAIEIIGSLTQGLSDNLPTIIESAVKLINTLANGILGMLPDIIQLGIDLTVSLIKGLIEALPTLIPQVINALVDGFVMIVENLDKIINPIIEALPSIIESLFESLFGENFTKIIQSLISLILLIIQKLPELIKVLTDQIPYIIEMITTAILSNLPLILSGLVTAFLELAKAIPNLMISIVKAIVGVFTGAWEGIKNVFSLDAIGKFFGNVWKGIKNAFGSVADWFGSVFSKAWQAVKNVFSKGGKIFVGIKDGIVSAFKAVVNAIIKGINTVVSVPFKAINSVLSKLKGINILGVKPFGWVKTFGVPQIPYLEYGGILKKGQVGILEGKGAEWVVPLEEQKGWMDKLSNNIVDKMGVSSFGGSQNVNVTVGIDDSANAMGLARALLPFLKIAEKEVYA